MLGVLGALGARGQVERSGRTTLQKLVQWMDGSKGLRSGGGEGGGYGQASRDIDWGAGRIRGGRKNEQRGVGLPGGESRPSPRRGGGRRRV